MDELNVSKEFYNENPENGNRQQKELHTYDLLLKLNIPFVRVDHIAADTIEACREIKAGLGVSVHKNLFLCNRTETDFYLLLMPGDKPFKTKFLSAQIGSSRLSFASPLFMEKFLNITPGSVSVLGLANDTEKRVKLLIDRDILNEEYFGCHPCINTSTVKVKTSDILEKFLPFTGHVPTFVTL